MSPTATDTPVVPLERYYRASEALRTLASARRLALLDVLSRRGPLLLGVAIFEGGMRTAGALGDAAELEKLGLIAVSRPTGRNLSAILQITPAGRRAIAMVDSLAGSDQRGGEE
jgi:hypothetical protein